MTAVLVQDEHRFRDEWLVRLLQQLPGITPDVVNQWRAERRPYIGPAVAHSGLARFDRIAEAVRAAFHIGFAPLASEPADKAATALVPEKIVRQFQVLPIRAEARRLELAMLNPLDDDAIRAAEWAANRQVVPLYCPPDRLDELLQDRLSPDAVVFNLLSRIEARAPVELLGPGSDEPGVQEPVEVRAPVTQLVNALISDAVARHASDIHIEHDDQLSLVRFRIDGLLRNVMTLPRYLGVGPVVSRIKIMAQLDVADRLRPQDGRARLRVGGDDIGLRVSTLPTRVGEKVVIRILNERAVKVSLETLGFAPGLLAHLRQLIGQPQGVLLVTGPTGSGKTTTLYAALNARRSESVNVVTVEDPVEYKLAGINQVQVNEKQGLTFASVLRSVLRQDPDVVLVGEIRDQETAAVTIQAAMTGHLVLSTLHTNDAAGAVLRLRDMGVEPFKVGAALLGVTAQRLVRRVCQDCAQEAPAEELNPGLRAALAAAAMPVRHVTPVGCERCGFSGYTGRFPVAELLVITPALRELITSGASADELRAEALRTGSLHTMEADGLHHISAGHTTQDEVLPHIAPSWLEKMSQQARLRPADAVAPAAQPAPGQGAIHAAPVDVPTVLVAVADDALRDQVRVAVAETGATVFTASDGPSALAVAARERPTLLLSDLALAGLDGVQVIRAATTVLGLDATTVLIVPESEASRHSDFLGSDFDDVVMLPSTAEEIRERARAAMLRRHGWSDAADVMRPPVPPNEEARLAALRSTGLLDSPPDERFDNITRTAQRLFNVPIALVSLVDHDRQWFKSNQGLGMSETSREISFCAHAINGDAAMIVEDAALDPRFAENPIVTGDLNIRFYAGHPIRNADGFKLGTLCLLDHKPRQLAPGEREALQDLAALVEREIERS